MPFLDNDGVTRLTEDYLDIFAPKEELGEGDGTNAGPIYELSAKGHAEQVSTTGKNLLPLTCSTTTINGVTFTRNTDGTITVNGTATAETFFQLSDVVHPNERMFLSGCPEGGSTTTYGLTYIGYVTDSGQGVLIELSYGDKAIFIRIGNGYTANNLVFKPMVQYYEGRTTEFEPYTGGAPSPSPDYPQEIQVVRGRNLAESIADNAYGKRIVGYAIGNTNRFPKVSTNLSAGTYTISFDVRAVESGSVFGEIRLWARDASDGILYNVNVSTGEKFAENEGGTWFISGYSEAIPTAFYRKSGVVKFGFDVSEIIFGLFHSSKYIEYKDLQITIGSTPQSYVPYGHVGMEVRDPDTDELISCTPIPLPQRGWVAGLPDGTADTLRLDGAGKVEWELADAETTTAATDGVTGTIGVDVLSTTGQIADGATVLYKLATPVTEDMGYVDDWPTDIPEGATISIPELDALNVKYFIANDSISQYANQWYERTKAMDIADVEDAVGDLASVTANLVTHDQFYVGYDEVNGKKMISIFKRGDI